MNNIRPPEHRNRFNIPHDHYPKEGDKKSRKMRIK